MDHSCYFCRLFVMLSCTSIYCCLVVTCWERAGLLALVCDDKIGPGSMELAAVERLKKSP